jgi:regulatory protein
MQISSLVLKNNRVQVFVDEQYVFSCTQNFVVKKTLYTGLELTNEELALLIVEAQRSIIEYKLVEYATGGLYAKRELAQKANRYAQKRFGFTLDPDEMTAALKKLEELRIYDETYVIKTLINAYTNRSKSQNYIKSKLMTKGFDKKTIEEFMEYTNPNDFKVNLKNLLEKKRDIISPKVKDKFELKQKLIQFAGNKGFQYKDIKEVLEELLQD